MKKEIVAIQGELGAYSHLAAINFFKNPEIKTCTTFEEAFQTAFQNENYKIIISEKRIRNMLRKKVL